MPFLTEKRKGISRPLHCACALDIVLVIFLSVALPTYSPAQAPKPAVIPPQKAEPTAIIDPLGRETPRGAVIGFLKSIDRQDFATAARYLQQTPGRKTNIAQLARELEALRPRLKINIVLLSDDPNGTIEPDLPPGQVRAGVVEVGGTTVDIVLVRVDDPVSGKIWLLSKQTVASLPKLYAQMESEEPTAADRIATVVLRGRQLLGMTSTQWLGWLLSIPVSWLLAWLLGFFLSMPKRVWYKLRKLPCTTIWQTSLGVPLRCIIAILMHIFFVYLLRPPIMYRVYYVRFMSALLVGSLIWLVSRIADRGFYRAVKHTRMHRRGGESILILMQRLSRVVMLIVAVLITLALFGLNVKTALAGIGIGGLAIALAAQKSLENLIGGVSLLMDKAIQVGDFCKIGDQVGTVEDIGLRSLSLRTLDQNLLVVPNGLLAQMQFENMRERSKLLINQNFSLRIETQVEQLRFVLDRVKSMLEEHPNLESESSRVCVTRFAGAAFELEIFAYGKTGDWTEFTAIRQDVILKIAEIVEAAGTRLAAPTQLTYLSRDAGVDAERADDIVPYVTELRASDESQLPRSANRNEIISSNPAG